MSILSCTATELSEKIRKKEISVIETIDETLKKIKDNENRFNNFNYIDIERAIYRANEIQSKIDSGEINTPVAGVPFVVKDNICVKNMKTTCSSKMLENYVPTYSATAVEILEEAGAIVIGKTNMDEFAMGSTTETSYKGVVKNPHNTKHVAGGSSGGSAVSVASGEVFFSLGSDTGGSIRQPAAYCGVTGLKPTYSSVSRYGLIAYASSFDQIGPICRDVRDCANIFKLISRHDNKDSKSAIGQEADICSLNVDSLLNMGVKGMKIGIPRDYFDVEINPEVKNAVLKTVEFLEYNGAEIEEFDLGYSKYVVPAYYTIAMAEAGSNLERYDGVKYGYRTNQYEGLHEMYKKTRSEGFGTEVKRRIMMGSFVLSSGYYDEYYLKALKIRELIKRRFDETFKKYDVIISPVSPITAPLIGKSIDNPIEMYNSDIFTVPANLAGLPGISVPCGKDSKGLPIGIQIIANRFEEKNIIKAAAMIENKK